MKKIKLPPLTEAERQALVEDIKTRGVLTPIIGRIIDDGVQRLTRRNTVNKQ